MVNTVTSKLIGYPHGFSTREGGVSTGVFDSLNLGLNRGDDEANVTENWNRFLASCGMEGRKFVCGRQVHGNRVVIVNEEDVGEAFGPRTDIEADGFVTNCKGVPMAVFTADCTPLVLTDEVNSVAAAVHCGWRSTVADIEKNAIDAMVSLGANVDNIKAAMGPALGICCFEVGPEVIDAASDLIGQLKPEMYKDSKNEGKYMLDLQAVIKERLLMLGIAENNIDIIGECTMCNTDRYWSHRGTAGIRGSQANIVMIPDDGEKDS